MFKDKPNYYAIIPANVRYDKDLQMGARLLYGEITALSNQTGQCWSSDKYFMDLYGVTKRTIQNWLGTLEEKGYIDRVVKYKDGGKEIEKRYITLVKLNALPYGNNLHYPMENNCTVNNTSINTTSNNIKDLCNSGEYDYKSVIDYLNLKTGKSFKNVEGNNKFIRSRYNEGYELEDFKTVIDNMVTEWSGTEWYNNGKLVTGDSLLRPQTLFGNKFDSYLNKDVKKKEISDIIEYS